MTGGDVLNEWNCCGPVMWLLAGERNAETKQKDKPNCIAVCHFRSDFTLNITHKNMDNTQIGALF